VRLHLCERQPLILTTACSGTIWRPTNHCCQLDKYRRNFNHHCYIPQHSMMGVQRLANLCKADRLSARAVISEISTILIRSLDSISHSGSNKTNIGIYCKLLTDAHLHTGAGGTSLIRKGTGSTAGLSFPGRSPHFRSGPLATHPQERLSSREADVGKALSAPHVDIPTIYNLSLGLSKRH
jgi:hypothetical protein